MCNNASMTVLYSQRETWTEDWNTLFIECRKWEYKTANTWEVDRVLEIWIVAEGDDIHTTRLLDSYSDAQAIREAINAYDKAYKAHPATWGVKVGEGAL